MNRYINDNQGGRGTVATSVIPSGYGDPQSGPTGCCLQPSEKYSARGNKT
jgi:hypothetical protein